MENYRNAVAALVLAFVFSTSALADDGILWTGLTSPPPPQADSLIHTDIAAPASETDVLTETMLNLLQNLLALL